MSSAGLLLVNETNRLSIHRHAFTLILEHVAERLQTSDTELSEEIEIAITGLPVISLDELDKDRFNQFRQAVQDDIVEMLRQGQRHDSALYEAAALQTILRRDRRSGLDLSGQSTVIINNESHWHAEEWIGEYLSILLIIFGTARGQMSWVKNLETSWFSHKQIDLGALSDSEFQLVVKFLVTSGNKPNKSLDLVIFNQYKGALVQALIQDARNQNSLLP